MDDYERSEPFGGNPAAAIDFARSILAQAGYRVDNTDSGIVAEHEGGFIRSQSGNPLYGASPIRVTVSGGRLSVTAGFGGVDKVKGFIVKLLLGLAVGLGGGLGLLFALLFDQQWPILLGAGLGGGIPLLQLPIHWLIVPAVIRRRAVSGLDTLVHNLRSAGR